MRYKAVAATAVAGLLALAMTACGSDDNSTDNNSSDGGDSGGGPLKIGLMYAQTGPSSETFKLTGKAIEARWSAYKDAGGKCASREITWVDGDDTNTAEGNLALAQKFVQQDKVDIIIQSTAYFYGSSQYMTTDPAAKKIPVLGGGYDTNASYFDTSNLVFPIFQPSSYSTVYENPGQYLKSKGVTKLAGIAYNVESSSKSLGQSVKSAEAAGIDVVYKNDKIEYGSKDVASIVQGIVDAKADGFYTTLNPDTAIAVYGGLLQAGMKLKAVVFPIGYGPELLQSQPAVQALQGVIFSTQVAPYDLHTTATDALAAALKKYTGNDSGLPSFAEAQGWLAGDEFVFGLEKAGCDASPADIAKALRASKTWDADGLLAQPRDFTTAEDIKELCGYYAQLNGTDFMPDGDGPICGKALS